MNNTIIIMIKIFIIIFICKILNKNNKHEFFTNKNETKKVNKLEKNIRSTINIIDDPFFDDVIIYNNDDFYTYFCDNSYTQISGMYKCIKNPNCNCIEFGYSGSAFCFSKLKNK
jgi:hypothetical protein